MYSETAPRSVASQLSKFEIVYDLKIETKKISQWVSGQHRNLEQHQLKGSSEGCRPDAGVHGSEVSIVKLSPW